MLNGVIIRELSDPLGSITQFKEVELTDPKKLEHASEKLQGALDLANVLCRSAPMIKLSFKVCSSPQYLDNAANQSAPVRSNLIHNLLRHRAKVLLGVAVDIIVRHRIRNLAERAQPSFEYSERFLGAPIFLQHPKRDIHANNGYRPSRLR